MPQFYLKRFTANGSKSSRLFAYDLKERKHYVMTPAKACMERDFNRVDADGLPRDALEIALARFEGKAAAALSAVIVGGASVDEQQWLWVLNLMALMAARNPVMRAQLDKVVGEMLHATLEQVVATPESWAGLREQLKNEEQSLPDASEDYEGMRDFIMGRKFKLEVPPGYHVPAEFDGVDAVIDSLAKRHWRIVKAGPETGGFVTSDPPVPVLHEDGTPPWSDRPRGYALPHTTVIFPLSPSMLAVGTFDRHPALAVTEHFVRRANMLLVIGAGRRVFAPHDRFQVEASVPAGFVTGL